MVKASKTRLSDGDSPPFRVAIAGCHRQVSTKKGSHNWASAFAVVPETTVVAVFDKRLETREQFQVCWRDQWGDIPAYDDYGLMLSETKPDIVCVATRQTMHAEQVEEAVRSGVRGILCDKPLATSLTESDRLLNVCEKADIPLAFGLDRRWSSLYLRLRSILDGGMVGMVTGVTVLGVPNLINHGCHYYDTALALAGDGAPIWVSGIVDSLDGEPMESRRLNDPPGRGWIGLDNGVHITICPEGGGGVSFTVLGTNGHLTYVDGSSQAYVWKSPKFGDQAANPLTVKLPLDVESWLTGPAAVKDLVEALRTGGKTACDVQEARRSTEIGFAIHASSILNGVRLPIPITARAIQIESFLWGNE